MLILAITTSTSYGSICFHDGKKTLYKNSWHADKSHAEILGPRIQEGLLAVKLTAKDISLVACDIGPGSFTGVRIGVSTAKAFAYANNIPVVAVDSLHLMAEPIKTDFPVLSIRDAQRQEVYCATFKVEHGLATETLPPQLMSLEQLEKMITTPHIVVGDGYGLLKDDFSDSMNKSLLREQYDDYPTAETLAELGLVYLKLNKTLEWKLLEPLYIRLSAAEEKLVKGEIKRHV